jgi:hypothetical protein
MGQHALHRLQIQQHRGQRLVQFMRHGGANRAHARLPRHLHEAGLLVGQGALRRAHSLTQGQNNRISCKSQFAVEWPTIAADRRERAVALGIASVKLRPGGPDRGKAGPDLQQQGAAHRHNRRQGNAAGRSIARMHGTIPVKQDHAIAGQFQNGGQSLVAARPVRFGACLCAGRFLPTTNAHRFSL